MASLVNWHLRDMGCCNRLPWTFKQHINLGIGSYGHHHRDSGFLGHDEKDVIP